MKNIPRVLVVIDSALNHYSRYVGKQRTHHYGVTMGQGVDAMWIELLRVKPESWKDDNPEAA